MPTEELSPEERIAELRATSWALRWMRLAAAVFVALQFTLYQPPPGIDVPFDRWPAAAAVIAAILVVNAASFVACRAHNVRILRGAGYGELVADTMITLVLVWMFAFDPQAHLWALLVVPVLEAAVRAQLAGALWVWAAVSLAYVVRDAWAAATFEQQQVNIDSLTYVAAVLGVVAVTVGILARSLAERTRQHARARAEAEARALELERARAQLAHLAFHDPLTELPNRPRFQEHLAERLEDASASQRTTVAVLFADLDGFKRINDEFGHARGDDVLSLAAQRLQSCVRPSDVVARLGGDEFTVLLDHVDEPREAEQVADRVVGQFEEPFRMAEVSAETTISVGLTLARPGFDSVDEVLRRADTAMYEAKRAGGGRWYRLDAGEKPPGGTVPPAPNPTSPPGLPGAGGVTDVGRSAQRLE